MPGFWARPGPRSPKTWHICSFPPCTTATARPNAPDWGGTPRSARTPSKNALFTKRRFHSKSSLVFSIFARSLLLPRRNERRDQMCQVFGLVRARGARKPGTFAPSLLAPQQRQGQMCRNGENPEIGPQSKTHFLRKEIITQHLALIFQFLPAPSSSLHPMNGETRCARFLGWGPRSPKTWHICSFPPCTTANGKAKCAGMGRAPRSAPTPIKNALFTKRRFHSKSGPDFSIFARSLFLPTPNERRDRMCQVFGLARPRWARKPGTFALSLLAVEGQMCRNGQSKTHFLRKEDFTQNLALIFQFLPAPSSSLHPMNGETKCARFLGSPGPAGPENLAHLLLPSLHHSNGKAKCAGMGWNPQIGPDPNQKRTFYEKKLSLKIWP